MSVAIDVDRLIFTLPQMDFDDLRRLHDAIQREHHSRLPPFDAKTIIALLSRKTPICWAEPEEPANVVSWRGWRPATINASIASIADGQYVGDERGAVDGGHVDNPGG